MRKKEENMNRSENFNRKPLTDAEGIWQHILATYAVGQVISRPVGKVAAQLGVFVGLEPGFDALIHVSQIRGLNGRNPRDFFATGEMVTAKIISIDPVMRRVQLATELPMRRPVGAMPSSGPSIDDGDLDAWLAQHPAEAQEAADAIRRQLQKGPFHGSLLGPLLEPWGVPKPRSLFARRMGFVCLPAGNPYSGYPSVALSECVGNRASWAHFQMTLDGTSTSEVIPMTADDERAAVDWLREQLVRAPLHGSLLSHLTKTWHVPKPVSGFVARHGFLYFPPGNKYSPHPAAAHPDYVEYPVYWAALKTRLSPTEASLPEPSCPRTDPVPSPKPVADGVHQRATLAEAKKAILIDGSNIIRYFADMRSKALAFLVEGLEANGFAPVVLFDANISYVLKDNGDDFGLELVDRYKRERPERTIVVPSGMRSDDYLLLLADRRGYPVVSCDTFKDEAFAKYAWLKNRVESGDKRVHAPSFVLGDLVIPTLGIVWPVG